MRTLLVAAVVSAVGLCGGWPAVAATDRHSVAVPAADAQITLDDRELSDFVAALVRLIGVQHGYMMMIQAEPDPGRAEAMKRQAVEDMTAAVERDGLSVDRYNAIAIAVKDSPELQGRVEAILQQMASNPDEPSE
ncbi:MAG: DUF4168 domain-containing protein [Magnetospirillum sp.]|nr:DUF4168 domain-containing protein [Magnetospirillum sp.]